MILVTKGQPCLYNGELEVKTQECIDEEWPQWKRERSIRKGDGEFNTYMEAWEADTDTNRANNLFNSQLSMYREAVTALADSETDNELRAYYQTFIDKTPTEVIEFYDAEGGNE